MAGEADPENVLAVKNVGSRAAYRPAPRRLRGFDPRLPPIEQPRVLMADLNGDGDEDLFIPSTQGSCFVERSFLSGGYAKARLLEFQQK